ncbi:MAG: hypothetical protein HZA17_05830 [Nitrospirae bacterium]|nr:hypothetical protein [Nitrospirota bacterium]
MRRTILISMVALLISLAGCQGGTGSGPAANAAPLSTPELQQAIGSGKKTVVFFLNPEGGPCSAQNEILQKLQQDRNGNFNVAYVNATKPADQQAFYDYGVRSLPSLVLVDGSGRISSYFPPGIQPYETLSQALDSGQ